MRRQLSLAELADIAGLALEDVQEFAKRGLLDPDGDGELDDFDILRLRIVLHYRSLGMSMSDIEKAVRKDSPTILYSNLLWGREEFSVGAEEAADESGLPVEVVRSILRAIGLGATIPKQDVAFLRTMNDLVEGGIPLAMLLDVARVYGDTMRRLAQTEVRMIRDFITEPGKSSLLKDREQSQRLNVVQELIGPILEPMLLTIHRRHLLRASVQEAVADLEAIERGDDRDQLQATIAFVDLASFTALAQIHGDEVAAQILDRFDELVRQLLEEHGGTMVKQIGDAFMLVFTEPQESIHFAVGLDAAAAREPSFPALRTGINTGPVLYRVGDYVGHTVNLAARIAAIARAGEILVTGPVADVARTESIPVVPAGEFDVAGVEEKVPMWRIETRTVLERRDRDPVCGMALGDSAVARLVYEGVEYGFCSPACLRRFLEEPERYLGSEDRSSKPEL